MSKRAWACFLAGSLLAACGSPQTATLPQLQSAPGVPSTFNQATLPSPTPTSKPRKPTAKPTAKPSSGKTTTSAPTNKGKPAPTPPKKDPAADLEAIQNELRSLQSRFSNFVALVNTWSTNGAKSDPALVSFTFQKPNTTVMEVVQHPEERSIGTKILWNGGDNCKVKTKFLGFPITVELPISDDRLTNTRGYTFAQTSFDVWFQHLTDPESRIRILGEQTLPNGQTGVMLECLAPQMLPKITKEVFGIDKTSKAPLLYQMYEGETLVYQVYAKTMSFDQTLPASLF